MPNPTRATGLHALYSLHRDHYRAYAHLLLGTADADLALLATYDHLADAWPEIIAAANPQEHAWQALRQRVHLLAGPKPLRPVAHLDPRLQDVLLLHHVLGLPADDIATLTGSETADINARLRQLSVASDCSRS
ncbi:hypothetical protein ACIOJE_27085 [Kitasatospora sp. NPDC087861]|uniref:hypothetical protein n=1 Tax=Kitasatospora sp. NPDC087861 TaxID=3364070 RepID=UPI00381252F1